MVECYPLYKLELIKSYSQPPLEAWKGIAGLT